MQFTGQALQDAVQKRVCKHISFGFSEVNDKTAYAQLGNNLHNSAESNKFIAPFSKGFF